MSLRKQQSEFVCAVGKLICYAYSLGYELTFGDTYPGKFKHKKGSFHEKGLAIDINLFYDGVYMTETIDHESLGMYWEAIGGTWGGHWGDGGHYSWNEGRQDEKET